jgi:outer membrane cobalamin receptor
MFPEIMPLRFLLARALAVALGCCSLLVGQAAAQAPDSARDPRRDADTVRGVVLDTSGAPLVADIHENGADGPVAARTDGRGRFAIPRSASAPRLTVTAPGFASYAIELSAASASASTSTAASAGAVSGSASAPGAGTGTGALRIVLQPASLAEQVTVTAGRRELRGADTPAATSTLTAADLLSGAAMEADDALRYTPGFTLFRRSSSRAANPTTQGVTLRGVSASGASRTLVLADGVPLNDPFGGWVYWGRVPQAAIERIEIVRGGMSDLYGADAVGGVINIIPWQPTHASARASIEGGSLDTSRVSIFGGAQRGRLDGSVAVERLSTDGAPIIAEAQRGSIDTPAGVTHHAVLAMLGAKGPGDTRVEVRGQLFSEDRQNGTPLQTNDTNQRQIAVRANGSLASGVWQVQGFGVRQTYDQAFSSVAADRASESLTQRQRVPSTLAGGNAEWFRTWSHAVFMAGAETKQVTGTTDETRFVANVAQTPTSAGGRQVTLAGFSQITVTPTSRLTVVGGARVDHWENHGRTGGDSQDRTPVSPRLDASFALSSNTRLRGAIYKAFRAPTLNELYRNFRAGDTLTQANNALAPEKLTGGETSLLWTPSRHSVRVTYFVTHLEDAVTNVTLSTTPTLTTRQRQNAGAVNAKGLELEGDYRVTTRLTVSGMGTITRSQFDGGLVPAIDGLDVPQVPRFTAGVSARFVDPRWVTASLQVRTIGRQFEDDRNTLVLDRATVVDLFAGRQLVHGAQVFAAVENLLDAEVQVGRTPILSVGLPRVVRVGVRVFWP